MQQTLAPKGPSTHAPTPRMNKKQQMRWNRATVQPFLDVRTAVLNDTLEDAFHSRHPGFRPGQ
jgi:hypothetical protein